MNLCSTRTGVCKPCQWQVNYEFGREPFERQNVRNRREAQPEPRLSARPPAIVDVALPGPLLMLAVPLVARKQFLCRVLGFRCAAGHGAPSRSDGEQVRGLGCSEYPGSRRGQALGGVSCTTSTSTCSSTTSTTRGLLGPAVL
eukprot:3936830-Rhodomonas_salina.2